MSYISQAGRKKRDEIDVIRVRLWYEEVRHRLSLNSSYQVEKAIEPEAFGKNEYGEPYHRNKWSGYEVGRHTPNKILIERVELRLRGSSDVLNNVFWEVLRGCKDIDWLMKEGVKSLAWEVQKVLYKYNKNGFSKELFSTLYTKELLRLERLAGLDSLAALIIFLRIADSKNYRGEAFYIGRSLYRTLLIVCTFQPYRKFTVELFRLMEQYVFPLTHNGLISVTPRGDEEIVLEVTHLSSLLSELECKEVGIVMSQKEKVRVMVDLIHGERDFRHKIAFSVPFEFRDQLQVDKPVHLLELQNMKKWAIECLRRGIIPMSAASVEFFPF